jgi:outer membrane protein W
VVVLHKNSGQKAFIPGWSFKLAAKPRQQPQPREAFLTTTQAVTLAMGDLVAFYIDPKVKAAPYFGVGFNVMVLKHAKSGDQVKVTSFSATRQVDQTEPTFEIWAMVSLII